MMFSLERTRFEVKKLVMCNLFLISRAYVVGKSIGLDRLIRNQLLGTIDFVIIHTYKHG